jgi:5-bromo-4-chloroindolyl phosphate hydrolysis protein
MMFALTTDSAKSTALIGLVVVIVLGILAALVIKAVITKVISLIVAAALSFGLFSQRASIQDCAKKVKENVLVVDKSAKTECKFFGFTVEVPTDKKPTTP